MKRFNILFILIGVSCFFSCKSQNQSEPKYNLTFENIKGHWRTNCETGLGFIEIFTKDSIFLEINSNQIYIIGRGEIQKEGEGKLIIYFKSIQDLGYGGMKLAWEDYSKTRPVAEIIYANNYLMLNWLGFFNQKNKTYEWVNQPDWFTDSVYKDNIQLTKCN